MIKGKSIEHMISRRHHLQSMWY